MVSNKYAHTKPSGHKESWPEIAERVVKNVVQPYYPEYASRIQEAITSREFIPGGRYLYAAGRRYQQLQNCFLFKAEDSREGWATL
jgi:ribonucleoside-diphosphate reductase alpha chain